MVSGERLVTASTCPEVSHPTEDVRDCSDGLHTDLVNSNLTRTEHGVQEWNASNGTQGSVL